MATGRARRVLAAAVATAALAAFTLFFYRDLLFRERVYVFRDQYTIVMAIDYVVQLLTRFDWPPLWTPFQVLGKPLAADPLSAVLYPFNWALRLLPWPLGFNASIALHHLWAAAGMYALLRYRALSVLAAAFGALLFGFGGFFVSLDNMINALQSSAWLPWTLLAFDVWCVQQRVAALAATALALALTLLGGMPEVFLFENVLFAAIIADRRRFPSGPPLLRAAAACVAANALAVGLAAGQLLPTAEYLLHSSRAAGLRAESVMRLALQPLGALAFLMPRHYVDAAGAFSATAGLWDSTGADTPWALSLYLGPALVFAALAPAMLDRTQRRVWIGVTALFSLLALGPSIPGFGWLIGHAPMLRVARYPEKFLLVVHWALAAAAAVGLERARRTPAGFGAARRIALGAAVLAVAVAAVVHTGGDFRAQLVAHDLVAMAVVLAGIAAVATAALARPFAAMAALLVLTAADLYRVNGGLLPTVSWADTQRVSPAARRIESQGKLQRIYSDGVGRADVAPFPDSFLQEQNLLLMEVANYYGIANLNAPASINLRDHERLEELIEQLPPAQVAPFFAAFNTSFVTSPKDLQRYPGLTPIIGPATPLDAYLYAVEHPLPRAYVPGAIELVADDDAAITYLRGAATPGERVAVDRAAAAADLPVAVRGSVAIDSYRPEQIELDASMETDGLVVLTDTFYPGWEARVDGQSVPIVRANYFARGVFVAAGSHKIVFRYRPFSFRIGALLSIITCGALLLAVLRGREKN